MGGSGGYFLWVGIGPESPTSNLPTINAREVVALASTHENLVVASGDICECPGEGNWLKWGDRWVRIAVSYCDEEVGVEGIRRLGKAVERWLEGERSTVDGLPKGDIK